MNGEIDIGGVFVPPLLVWCCLAVVPYILIRNLLQWVGLYRFVWHRALFDIALFAAVLGAIDIFSIVLIQQVNS